MVRYYLKWRSHARRRASGRRNVATRRDVTWRRVGGRCCHRSWRSLPEDAGYLFGLSFAEERPGRLWKKRLTNWRRHYCCCRDPGRIRPTTRSLYRMKPEGKPFFFLSLSFPSSFSPSTNGFLHPCPLALVRTERKIVQARENEEGGRKGQRRRISLDLTLGVGGRGFN